jgi:hypothetical protein
MKKRSLDSGCRVVWEPETLRDYMEIADADLRLDEVFDVFPEIHKVELYGRRALEGGGSVNPGAPGLAMAQTAGKLSLSTSIGPVSIPCHWAALL